MLNVVSVDRAKEIIDEKFNCLPVRELVNISDCDGRIVYEDIFSAENIPCFDRSTVDGYAVRSADTFGSSEAVPAQLNIIGETLMGEKSVFTLNEGECVRVSTGGMLPVNADAVVMVENTDDGFSPICLVFKAVSPFENVTKCADDVKQGDIVCKKHTRINARQTGIFSCLGITEIPCVKKLKVGIISTGDEIISVEEKLTAGKIRDINSYILSSLVLESGCIPKRYGIINDNRSDIVKAIKTAVNENDIVLVSGGSSAGEKDMTANIISELGEVYLHGIAMKPGKPTIVGKIGSKAVFGLPGHPTAAYFVYLTLVGHMIESVYGKFTDKNCEAILSSNISSNHGREEIVCVHLEKGIAHPVLFKSGIVSLLNKSDGYIRIARNTEGLKKGDKVKVYLF